VGREIRSSGTPAPPPSVFTVPVARIAKYDKKDMSLLSIIGVCERKVSKSRQKFKIKNKKMKMNG
jgi:hypothetical protein